MYFAGMHSDHRRQRLLTFIARRYPGDRKGFLRDARISGGRLSQLLKPGAVFGERAARHLEESLRLPDMYFDQDEQEQATWSADVVEGARILARMTAAERRKAVAVLGAMLSPEHDEPPDKTDGSTKGARH